MVSQVVQDFVHPQYITAPKVLLFFFGFRSFGQVSRPEQDPCLHLLVDLPTAPAPRCKHMLLGWSFKHRPFAKVKLLGRGRIVIKCRVVPLFFIQFKGSKSVT